MIVRRAAVFTCVVGLVMACGESDQVTPTNVEVVDTVVIVDTVIAAESPDTVIIVDTVITVDTLISDVTVIVVDTVVTTDTLVDVDTVIVNEGPAPSEEAAVYSGSRGLVIDTRELARRGYVPTTVEVAFIGSPELDAQLEVDAVTNLAVLVLENDSLTDAEETALQEGSVDVTVVVFGDSAGVAFGVELARLTGTRPVDASNLPLTVDNPALPVLLPPLVIPEYTPLLMAIEGRNAVVTVDDCRQCIFPYPYPWFRAEADTANDGSQLDRQGFHFIAVPGEPDTYTIQNYTYSNEGTFLFVDDGGARPLIDLGGGTNPLPPSGPAQFILEQEEGGWVRLQVKDTPYYLPAPVDMGLWYLDEPPARFRLIADEIEWDMEHLGTSFNQPIIPPARIALANQSTIRNCSVADVVEVLGRSQSRSVTTSFSTSESFQLVTENSVQLDHSVDIEVNINYTPPFSFVSGGTGGGVTASVGHSWGSTVTTTSVRDTTRVSQSDTSDVVQVTRSREIMVPQYSGVTAVDWVRTVEDVVIPWVQRFRFRGYNEDVGQAMTGLEIQSQLRANGVGVIVSGIGPDYVEFTMRGSSTTDNFYQSESTVRDIVGACVGAGESGS